jgi:DNA polymerase
MEEAGPGLVSDVLALRQQAAKTSVKKYVKMQQTVNKDGRVRGLFQFYGANRTGRWAGRLVQLQNLPQNHIENIELAKELFTEGSFQDLQMFYGDQVSQSLSELIRTSFIAPDDKLFAVADFSAIEARVIAWLAGEDWRLRVFQTHGKIYEASAASMFNVDFDSITKDSELRVKGKIAELALGYQGSIGALKAMGAESMGLIEEEMAVIVKRWRRANPKIVKLWKLVEQGALRALGQVNREVRMYKGILTFNYDGRYLTIQLPSKRKLFYVSPKIITNKFGLKAIQYMGVNDKNQWGKVDSYGGKLTENIVQAIARDLLMYSLKLAQRDGFKIVLHVHDEMVAEVDEHKAQDELDRMIDIMRVLPKWAKGLPIDADGFVSKFYRK